MKPYYEDERAVLHHGDCLDVLATMPDASVDAIGVRGKIPQGLGTALKPAWEPIVLARKPLTSTCNCCDDDTARACPVHDREDNHE